MQRGNIVVEQRGSHFVAWETDAGGKPRANVLMVGRTAEEAEARLKEWFAASGK